MSVVSPLWPITTRLRSTPSLSKMSCCSSPRRVGAWVCVEIGHARLAMGLGNGAEHPLDSAR